MSREGARFQFYNDILKINEVVVTKHTFYEILHVYGEDSMTPVPFAVSRKFYNACVGLFE